MDWFVPILLAAALPTTVLGAVSANLTWEPSSDSSVTGYNLYFGGASGQYTNSLSLAAVTNTVVPNLAEGVTYFFAAKAHNSAGSESPFSNEAIFCGLRVAPNTLVNQAVITTNVSSDHLTFSLDGVVPPGASINPTNGVFNWVPGLAYAATTNAINVLVTDNTSSNLTTTATLLVVVSDYMEIGLGSTAVQSLNTGVLPITVTASGAPADVQFTLNWPTNQLGIPVLALKSPAIAGSLQIHGSTAVVSLEIEAGQSLTNGITLAQITFQPPANQPSAFIPLEAANAAASMVSGSFYRAPTIITGQITVVGTSPLLQLQSSSGPTRPLTLFGHPGSNYEVQFTTNLTPPVVWTTLANHWQTDVSDSVDVDASQPVIYYRLQGE